MVGPEDSLPRSDSDLSVDSELSVLQRLDRRHSIRYLCFVCVGSYLSFFKCSSIIEIACITLQIIVCVFSVCFSCYSLDSF